MKHAVFLGCLAAQCGLFVACAGGIDGGDLYVQSTTAAPVVETSDGTAEASAQPSDTAAPPVSGSEASADAREDAAPDLSLEQDDADDDADRAQESDARAEETPAVPADDEGPPPCDAVAEVFQKDCSGYGCHGGVTFGDFAASPARAASFVDKLPTINTYPGCGVIIDSENPLKSLILRKVLGEYEGSTACGAQMPLGSTAMLSADKVACIESWLTQFQK